MKYQFHLTRQQFSGIKAEKTSNSTFKKKIGAVFHYRFPSCVRILTKSKTC